MCFIHNHQYGPISLYVITFRYFYFCIGYLVLSGDVVSGLVLCFLFLKTPLIIYFFDSELG